MRMKSRMINWIDKQRPCFTWSGKKMKTPVILIITFLFIANCSKNVITQKYYVLDFTIQASDTVQVAPLTKDVLEVLPVQITETYARHRIAVRKRSHEITFYNYHQWAESPDQNIGRLVQKQLDNAHLFARVSDRIWNVAPRYQLNTFITHVEAVEGDDSLFAHLSIDLEIIDRTLNRVVVSHSFDRQIGYEDWDLNFLAQGMSVMLKEETNAFIDEIHLYLTSLSQTADSSL